MTGSVAAFTGNRGRVLSHPLVLFCLLCGFFFVVWGFFGTYFSFPKYWRTKPSSSLFDYYYFIFILELF